MYFSTAARLPSSSPIIIIDHHYPRHHHHHHHRHHHHHHNQSDGLCWARRETSSTGKGSTCSQSTAPMGRWLSVGLGLGSANRQGCCHLTPAVTLFDVYVCYIWSTIKPHHHTMPTATNHHSSPQTTTIHHPKPPLFITTSTTTTSTPLLPLLFSDFRLRVQFFAERSGERGGRAGGAENARQLSTKR